MESKFEKVPADKMRQVLTLIAENRESELTKLLPPDLAAELVNLASNSIGKGMYINFNDSPCLEKPLQNESSNSSTFIANSHSIFANSTKTPSPEVPKMTGRQIAEKILVPMLKNELQLPEAERRIFVSWSNIIRKKSNKSSEKCPQIL